MNKSELVGSMSEKADITKAEAEKALNAFIESVEEAQTTTWLRVFVTIADAAGTVAERQTQLYAVKPTERAAPLTTSSTAGRADAPPLAP